jgi:hypothetical protein
MLRSNALQFPADNFIGTICAASGRDATRRRRHEFRADRVGNDFAQDPIDLGPGRVIERPASYVVDRLQLTGMTRPHNAEVISATTRNNSRNPKTRFNGANRPAS